MSFSRVQWFVALVLFAVGGCTAPVFEVQIDGPPGVLTGGSAHLTAWVAGGKTPYQCSWSDGSTQLGTDCTQVDVTPTGDATYTLTVTDGKKHTATGSIALKVYDPIAVTVPAEMSIVRGETASIDATVSGGVPDVTCSWLVGGQVVANGCSGLSVQPTADTVYDLAVVDGDSDVQVGSTLVRVYDPLAGAFDPAAPQQVLPGDDVTLTPNLTGGVPPLSCTWTQDGTQVSTDCGAYSYTASDSSSLTLAVADAQGHTAQVSADVAVLKVVPIAAQTVISNDTLSLLGSATGLIGDPECLWTDAAGHQLNSGTDCQLDLVVVSGDDLTLKVTDATTGLSASIDVPVTMLAPTCSDHVQNGTETDVDCGGRLAVGWFNEFLPLSVPGYGALLEVEIVLPTYVDATTLVPEEYGLNAEQTAYVPLAPQQFGLPGVSAALAACGQDTTDSNTGVQTAVCTYTTLATNLAYTVSRPDGSLIDFVLLDNSSPRVPASGGPADGLTPRRLGVTVPILVYSPLSNEPPPTEDTCLEGTGIQALDFTWHTDCAISMSSLISTSTGLNPDQTVTGFKADCPRCQQDQMCLVPEDCTNLLTCDPTSLTCVPPSL